MSQLSVQPDQQTIATNASETLLDALLSHEIPHTHACGGQAYCSTCRVLILDGIKHCSSPTRAEKALAQKLQFPIHVRLACQTKISGDVTIRRLVMDNQDLDLVDQQLTGGQGIAEQELVLLYAGLKGMETFDQVNFPYDMAHIMGRYFQQLYQIISTYGGQISSTMGTHALVTFDPARHDRTVDRAVWAALDLLQAMAGVNQMVEQLHYQPLQLGLAVHPGLAVQVAPTPKSPPMPLGDGVTTVMGLATLPQTLVVSPAGLSQIANRVVLGAKVGEAGAQIVTGMRGAPPEQVAATPPELSLGQRLSSLIQKFRFGR
ncbi:adenylate cyclase [Gloeomargarita lithophora Alchichica-D10]|uniref:Adenylate cyclase n=1 Tax=Gloeomargarita lithophora Alchichica-D10 TaxID=1188229 RepID=A0A1J0ABL4_9CYAN|nr:2Fe-2S iron-sulfur cluster-binding protein [Gloeomargarita lithophora]APB33309.1 adenylate cyclase [Gloeomargarita lithophora Alchichica-D10]